MKAFIFIFLMILGLSCNSTVSPVEPQKTEVKKAARTSDEYPEFITGQWKMTAYSSTSSPVNFTAYKNTTGCYLTNRWLFLTGSGGATIVDRNYCSPSSFSGWGSNAIDFFAWNSFQNEIIHWAAGVSVGNPNGSFQFSRNWNGNSGDTIYGVISFDPYSNYTIMYWQTNGITIKWERASGGPWG